jgi:putative oxidoreductase
MPTSNSNVASHIGWLIARIVFGLAITYHGYNKVFGMTPDGEAIIIKFTAGVAAMGFPQPVFFAWAAALSEFAGGILLVIGLLDRVPAFFLTITLAVALYRHHAQSFAEMELALLFFAVFLSFLVAGPGRFSLDRVIFFRDRTD